MHARATITLFRTVACINVIVILFLMRVKVRYVWSRGNRVVCEGTRKNLNRTIRIRNSTPPTAASTVATLKIEYGGGGSTFEGRLSPFNSRTLGWAGFLVSPLRFRPLLLLFNSPVGRYQNALFFICRPAARRRKTFEMEPKQCSSQST